MGPTAKWAKRQADAWRHAKKQALGRDVPHPNAVRFALERRRQERQQPPPIAVDLPPHVQARDVPVRPVRLELYDQLKRSSDE